MKKLIFILTGVIFALSACVAQNTHYDGVHIGTNGSLIDSSIVVGNYLVFYSGGNSYFTSLTGISIYERGIVESGGTVGFGGTEGSPATLNADSYVETSNWYLSLVNNDSPVGYNGLFLDDGGAFLYAGPNNRAGGPGNGKQGWFSASMGGGSPYYATIEMGINAPSSQRAALYMDEKNQEVVFVDGRVVKKGIVYDQPDNTDWTDTTLVPKIYVDNAIVAGITKEISYTACTANSTTNIVIGSTTTDVALVFRYVAERNTGSVVEKIMGDIEVIYDDVADDAAYFSTAIPGAGDVDLGMGITADVSGSDIRLNIIVDNSNANTLSIDIDPIHKFQE